MCHMVVALIIPAVQATRIHKHFINLHLCTDIFVRDVRSASSIELKTCNKHEIVFNTGEKDIGWYYSNHTLERKEGVYKNNKWKKHHTSIVTNAIAHALFTADYHKGILVGIHITIMSSYSKKHCTRFVAVRKQHYA